MLDLLFSFAVAAVFAMATEEVVVVVVSNAL